MPEASTVYADRTLLPRTIPAAAVASISTTVQDDALRTASRTVDSYLLKRWQLPLSQWGEDLTQVTLDIAAYRLLKARGFSPQSADAEQYRNAYDDAIRWLEQVAKGLVTPTDIIDSSVDGTGGTDAVAEAAVAVRPLAYQVRAEQGVTDSFWDTGEATDGSGIGTPRRRGW